MAAVRASGLVKRFESTLAVDGVDLVVQEGELRGLLGPNGAGKRMQAAGGHQVVNPLFVLYGCFNPL